MVSVRVRARNNVCVRHNKEKTVYGRPKLLMIKWLGLSVTVRVRVRVRD